MLNTVSALISDAIEQNPGRSDELQCHSGEISKSQRVVELIRSQKGLRTLGVVSSIKKLKGYGNILMKALMALDVDKGISLLITDQNTRWTSTADKACRL
jgi:hypothetical protein